MIRLGKQRFLILQAVNLYRDDLDYLVEMMSKDCASFEISDNNFKYETLDEMQKAVGANPRGIEIFRYHPFVRVSVWRFGFPAVQVYAGGDPEDESVFLRVTALLQSRKRILSRVFDWRIWTVLFLGYWVLLTASSSGGKIAVLSTVKLAALLGVDIVALAMRTGCLSRLSLTLRHETDTFWRRNADKLVLAVICTILGIILKSLWDWLVARFSAGGP
jgi:hypothetical protein